jgi:hypothetical protein
MSNHRWLVGVVGAVLGVMATTFAHNRLQAPPLLAPGMRQTCDVPATFGTVKGTWGEWLVFEDSTGTLRSVDALCEVRHTIARQ